ncbi:AAA family ATPase [Pectobacterium polaris]|uniref:AAA family ATPase n=2 Tax=Pectobacterium TaxID=122277 RepID=UPI002B240153|nr:AAA family ATPase [Pectobacterium polaris]
MSNVYEEAKSKKDLGFHDNKKIPLKSIKSIYIKKFRSLEDRMVELGEYVTVLIGRNGTMKTSVMGLIAHPFITESKDAFGKQLKTSINEVFKLSTVYDVGPDKYDIYFDIGENSLLKETVTVRLAKDGSERHRIVISGHEQGDGNFTYNTSFLNLKRLLPMVDTAAKPDEVISNLTPQEKSLQRDFYETILPSMDYTEFTAVYEVNNKTTFAPCGDKARYDYQAISSGEDNLGSIFNRLIGFQRAFDQKSNNGNGIFCIDEFESGLHPIAQWNLFNYLLKWSKKYKVQLIITTHSLHLIQNVSLKHDEFIKTGKIVLNFFSKANVGENRNYNIIKNPNYSTTYKELTFEEPKELNKIKKINVLCEDKIAIHFIKSLIKNREILSFIDFQCNLNNDDDNDGTSYSLLTQLCSNFSVLLSESFVVFDPDVNGKLNKIKNINTYIILPDEDNLAIERRIIIFILNLPGDDVFFKKFNNEKEIFINSFKNAGLKTLDVNSIKDEKVVGIKVCKKWAEGDIVAFKKYITYYVSKIDSASFRKSFLERVNYINKNRGLPLIQEGI